MNLPLVSVIMPVFNAGTYLEPALRSVFSQSLGDFELLLVDDGGTDGSGAYLRTLDDDRVRVLDHGPGRLNRGIPASRNLALAAARGEFVAFLNHDDVSTPERLQRQVAFLHEHPDIGLLGSTVDHIDTNGGHLDRVPLPTSHLGIRWMGLLDCPVRQSAMMARRTAFQEHDLRYDETFVSNSDYEFIERMTRSVLSANLPLPLTSYRKHATNTSRVRYSMFVEAGNRISYAAIRHELPEFKITLEQVATVRSVVLSYTLPSTPRSLAATKLASERYLDLVDAFREKHRSHSDLAGVPIQASPNQ